MIKHIVFFKLKKELAQKDKNFYAQKIVELLKPLPQIIPQIKLYEIGINISDRPSSFDVALISEFENQQDLDIYRNHPEHKKAVEQIKEFIESSAVVDYDKKLVDFKK